MQSFEFQLQCTYVQSYLSLFRNRYLGRHATLLRPTSRCVTTQISAAKETKSYQAFEQSHFLHAWTQALGADTLVHDSENWSTR